MKFSIDNPDHVATLQGGTVMVRRSAYPNRVFKIIRFIGEGANELRLVYRAKDKKTVDWPLAQAHLDALEPAPEEFADQAKWLLDLE